jgi:hypothetical protein
MYDSVNTSLEIIDLAKPGYRFLETTLSVNPNNNRLLCAHYLPADRADSLVDMDRSP